jgi:hypothetical protein
MNAWDEAYQRCLIDLAIVHEIKRGNYRHGHYVNKTASHTYRSWVCMKNRIHPKSPQRKDYFERGIGMVDRWKRFENFLEDMGERPQGMMMDRINNDLGYSPENCRWVNRTIQNRNTRRNRFLEFRGESRTVAEWAEITGIDNLVIAMRLDRLGWSVEEALTLPASPVSRNKRKVDVR